MIRPLSVLAAISLFLACLFWLVEDWLLRCLGLEPEDNCFTWAVRHYSYHAGDGGLVLKSVSGWFPHVVIVRGAHAETAKRTHLELIEYVPRNRVPKWLPPRKFDGEVKVSRFVRVEG